MQKNELKRNLTFNEKLLLIIEIGKKFGVKKMLLFGSSLEKPETANDIDSPIDVVPIEANSNFIQYIERHSRVLI